MPLSYQQRIYFGDIQQISFTKSWLHVNRLMDLSCKCDLAGRNPKNYGTAVRFKNVSGLNITYLFQISSVECHRFLISSRLICLLPPSLSKAYLFVNPRLCLQVAISVGRSNHSAGRLATLGSFKQPLLDYRCLRLSPLRSVRMVMDFASDSRYIIKKHHQLVIEHARHTTIRMNINDLSYLEVLSYP